MKSLTGELTLKLRQHHCSEVQFETKDPCHPAIGNTVACFAFLVEKDTGRVPHLADSGQNQEACIWGR